MAKGAIDLPIKTAMCVCGDMVVVSVVGIAIIFLHKSNFAFSLNWKVLIAGTTTVRHL